MKVSPCNCINQQNKFNQQKVPSFKANLHVTDKVKKLLENELVNFFLDCPPEMRSRFFKDESFNFDKIFSRYKNAVEAVTKDIGGTINLHKRMNGEGARITYTNSHGKALKTKKVIDMISVQSLLPDALFDCGRPLEAAARRAVSIVSEILTENGYGYGKSNPFAVLCDKMEASVWR